MNVLRNGARATGIVGASPHNLLGIGATLVIVVLLLLAPTGEGAPSHRGPIVVTPPFVGGTWVSTDTPTAGCGSVQVKVPPTLNLTAGVLKFTGQARSHICHPTYLGTGAGSSASIVDQVSWATRLPTIPTGVHRAVLVARVGFAAGVSISARGSCASTTVQFSWGFLTTGTCEAFASVNVWGNDSIVDLTNGSRIVLSDGYSPALIVENSSTIDWGCYNLAHGGGCFGSNATFSTGTNKSAYTAVFDEIDPAVGQFVSSHHYAYEFQGYIEMVTNATGWRAASASAYVTTAGLPGVEWRYLNIS